ncbi:MAG: hypothetical protein L0H96_25840 [Humibacillus sp.]|nr:hypothetical protein [Humibacillus sp.]MDN5780298.1 hypothetical protein [Humibacillus sp.]
MLQRYEKKDTSPAPSPMLVTTPEYYFAVKANGPAVYVRIDANGGPTSEIADALKPTGTAQTDTPIGTLKEYSLGQPVLKDCLHAAEEIINNQVDQLEHGGGIYSKITTNRGVEEFGESDELNRDRAKQYAGSKDVSASPDVGQAFVIVATTPNPSKKISQFHAGAVVGRDGDDCVVLETWNDVGKGNANANIYTVNDLKKSFHAKYGGPGSYFEQHGPTTIVITPL